MTEKIDYGPIIGIDSFDIEPGDDYIRSNTKIFESAFKLFRAYRKRLLFKHEALLPSPLSWGKHFKTQADLYNDTIFDNYTIDENRLNQLIRAFGQTQELCLLRFRQDNKIYFFDYTKQNAIYKADIELFKHKFYNLVENNISIKLKMSPTFYRALLKDLTS